MFLTPVEADNSPWQLTCGSFLRWRKHFQCRCIVARLPWQKQSPLQAWFRFVVRCFLSCCFPKVKEKTGLLQLAQPCELWILCLLPQLLHRRRFLLFSGLQNAQKAGHDVSQDLPRWALISQPCWSSKVWERVCVTSRLQGRGGLVSIAFVTHSFLGGQKWMRDEQTPKDVCWEAKKVPFLLRTSKGP